MKNKLMISKPPSCWHDIGLSRSHPRGHVTQVTNVYVLVCIRMYSTYSTYTYVFVCIVRIVRIRTYLYVYCLTVMKIAKYKNVCICTYILVYASIYLYMHVYTQTCTYTGIARRVCIVRICTYIT